MSDSLVNTSAKTKAEQIKRSFFYYPRIILMTGLLALWIIFMVPLNFLWKLLRLPKQEKFFLAFHRGCCWIFGLQYRVSGIISEHKPSLFLSNHISYLDIFVLGGLVPGFFVAKSEVSGWPILGALAKVQNTLFIERNSKKIRSQLRIMSDHFSSGKNLILFPEGTSTEGEHVEPFKSSLFQSIESSSVDVYIQPITIAYTRYKNKPMSRAIRDQYAWYATMPFASHFFNAMTLGRAEVEVIFHQPVLLSDFSTRKECALYCYQQVADGLALALDDKLES